MAASRPSTCRWPDALTRGALLTRLAALSTLALAALAACAPPPPPAPTGPRGTYEGPGRVLATSPRAQRPPVVESTATGIERAYVTAILSDLQQRSFAQNREFCGYIGLDPVDRWMTTPVMAGTEASCPLPTIPSGMRVVASFHTHSTYSPYYASEWPTTQDVATDAADDIDGYIATPGGRLWHVDTDTMTVRQLCGRGCLPQDPAYVAADDGPLRPVMTYGDLLAWERSPF
ncbi:DUF4329 domain-containing protein [Rubellimicrobium roseum]|uniref:DUF4329 domain-containing protein n=1 Tax=Rubellimicrobium roseum TaxID=687525 RepID=A0A5C4NB72_9RHOB|nr:DUF4329 domain-containing protein [Rubellimicrobium roseum]TNC65993.1 DUF4329 domain-containing protein [Rubellimicrobium roseum]